MLAAIDRLSVSFPVELFREPAEYATYSQVDTHWTDFGAFLGSNDILKSLGLEPLRLEEACFSRVISSGDLGIKLLHKRDGDNVIGRLTEPNARKVFDNMIPNHGRMWIFENPETAGPTCLLFGDSFNVYGAKWLAERFRRLVCLHSVSADERLIRQERPDVVVGEVVERFLIIPPDDMTTFSVEELWERKYRLMPHDARNKALAEMQKSAPLTGSGLAQQCVATLQRVIAE
ncbi:MAG: hypothetical protein AB7G25_03015 [Sphingomonadaceae bacterium]